MRTVLCLIFFLSGASALIFESLWFQLTGLAFGNSVWAVTIVLASFMGGMALGNGFAAFYGDRIRSPLRFYAGIELIIAITGVAIVFILTTYTGLFMPIFRMIADHQIFLNTLRGGIAFLIMLIPATAMGATLPVLVRALNVERSGFGKSLGLLYGFNTLGAVCGVLSSEILFLQWAGIKGAGLIAAGFNLIAAAMALWIARSLDEKIQLIHSNDIKAIHGHCKFYCTRILGTGFLTGFILLALEVVWFRLLIIFYPATSWTFSIMLATVLAGIGCGGLLAARLFTRNKDIHHHIVPLLIGTGILTAWLYINFGEMLAIGKGYNTYMWIMIVSLFLMFPVSLFSGVIFIMLGKTLHDNIRAEAKTTGLLTLANTVGSMTGSMIAGTVMIPLIGIENSFYLLTILYGVAAILIFNPEHQNRQRKTVLAAFSIILAATVFLFPFGRMEEQYVDYPIEQMKKNGEKRIAYREGVITTIQYLQKNILGEPYYHRLITDNHSMSGTGLTAKRYMNLYVYWPMALHKDLKTALLICYGCGNTAKAMTDSKSLERIEIVDISKNIVQMSENVFPNPENNPINDARVNVHIEDGRFFMMATDRTFDLITGEPPPPKYNGVVNLYTQEYFQLVNDRLNQGGIITYWLPVFDLTPEETRSILKAFINVFPNGSIWTEAGFNWMMVGVKEELKPVTYEMFVRQWNDPVVSKEMKTLGFESPEQLGSLFIADRNRLKEWIGSSKPLVDNYPQRLRPFYKQKGRYRKEYETLMEYEACRRNFNNSPEINRIWPALIRKESGRHFKLRHISHEIFKKRNPQAMDLDLCILNPGLENCALWALRSDSYAQEITNRVVQRNKNSRFDRKNIVEVYRHLIAGSVQKGDYPYGSQILQAAFKNNLREFKNKDYYFLQMYLRVLTGHIDEARKTGEEYINLNSADKVEREKQVNRYWEVLRKRFQF